MELRHDLRKSDNGWRYGPWHIAPAGWIRPHPSLDWDWWHEDLDEDDTRYGYAESRDACIEAIHEWEDGAMTKINLDELIADREAGTDGPWLINNYNCTAGAREVAYAKERGRSISVGDILWSLPRSIGPINIDHNHWAGYYLTVSESDARRIARLPDLEAAYLEAVEALAAMGRVPEKSSLMPGLDHIANFLNSLDTEGMTALQVRKAIYSECLEPGCKGQPKPRSDEAGTE